MRAIVCNEYGTPGALAVSEVEKPSPAANQVLIRVCATGIGFVDALTVAGLYQIKPALPFIPGTELAGVVEQVGEGVTHLKIGQRVAALGGYGGLAEYASVQARQAVAIPDHLDFIGAASFLINYCTAFHGLSHCANMQPGETLLVLGASGGVGMAAIDVARAMGATIVAAASTEAKRAACIAAGAHHAVDYLQDNWRQSLKELLADSNLNVVYDPVGGKYSEPALRSLSPEGRFLVVGFASGNIPKIPINLALLKRCSISGVNWGAHMAEHPDDATRVINQLVGWIEQGEIHPEAGKIYSLEETGDAMMAMLNREAIGKVVIEIR